MIPLTPSFLVAAAAGFVGLGEQGEGPRDAMVALVLRGVRQAPHAPWSAAFVHHVGFWSHFDFGEHRSSWPLPHAGSCAFLGAFARRSGVLRGHPQVGDVFLLAGPADRRFAHAGIVARVIAAGLTAGGCPWFDCDTIEGNALDDDRTDGWGVRRRARRFHPSEGDRFIRWADLDPSVAGRGPPVPAPRAA